MINLFIVGFAPLTDKAALEEMLRIFGQVIQTRVMRDPVTARERITALSKWR